jgi:CRP/FNR family transcriptional regulator
MTKKIDAYFSDTLGLQRLPQFQILSDDTMRQLSKIGQRRVYAADQTLYHVGENLNNVGFILTGYLRLQKTLYNGRQHIVGLLVEGDMLGRTFDGPSPVAIEAASETVICSFQRTSFEALLIHSPELERLAMLNLLNELDRARDWMVILANPRIMGRLAGFLLVLCNRFGNVDHLLRTKDGLKEVKIPISRRDLSHLLGTTPESISRGFHALADLGAIEIHRSDLIQIRDTDALAEQAGDGDIGNGFDTHF